MPSDKKEMFVICVGAQEFSSVNLTTTKNHVHYRTVCTSNNSAWTSWSLTVSALRDSQVCVHATPALWHIHFVTSIESKCGIPCHVSVIVIVQSFVHWFYTRLVFLCRELKIPIIFTSGVYFLEFFIPSLAYVFELSCDKKHGSQNRRLFVFILTPFNDRIIHANTELYEYHRLIFIYFYGMNIAQINHAADLQSSFQTVQHFVLRNFKGDLTLSWTKF